MSKFTFEKLPNKTNIPAYLLYLPYLNSVSTAVVVKAGTVDEIWPQEAGLAHALEHLVLRGTKKFPSAQLLSGYIEEVGGFKGGTTDYGKTMYYGQVPAKYAERLIETLVEIVNSYLIPENAISKEIQVIQEEMKRKYDNPLQILNFKMRDFLFNSHPLGREVLGLEESLQKLNRSNFVNFASKYYYPANFTILIVGNLTPNKAMKFIEKYFFVEGNPQPNIRSKVPFIDTGKRELKFTHNVKQAQLELVAPLGSPQERSTKILKMFSDMIGMGVMSPLFQEIREKRGLAYHISTFVSENSISVFHIQAGTKPEACEEVISLVLRVIEENKKSSQLLVQTKKRLQNALLLSFDNPNFIIRRAAQDVIYQGKPRGYQELVEEIKTITIKDIENVVDTYLTPNNFRRIIMLPK